MGTPARAARRWAKLGYVAYYRWIYAASFPGSRRLRSAVEELEQRLGHGDTPEEQSVWEEKYRSGRWAYMREADEHPRYAYLAKLVHQAVGDDAAVLDVGCGEGLLVDHLRATGYGSYLGIDVSAEAIRDAAAREDGQTAFRAGDAEALAFEGERFDAIVFNESLCYFRDPGRAVDAYAGMLVPNGAFVVSSFRTPRHDAIGRLLARRYDVVEEFELPSPLGRSTLRILRPPTRARR